MTTAVPPRPRTTSARPPVRPIHGDSRGLHPRAHPAIAPRSGATSGPMGWARNVFGTGVLLGLLALDCWRCGGRRHRSREFIQQGERSLRWT